MILFKDDVVSNRCIVDTTTKNTSFIKMSMLLRRMGIKNNTFMLALTQPELRDYDPYDEDLPQEIALKMALECVTNPWYFLREIQRVPIPGGTTLFQLNRASLATTWCFLANVNSYLTMPRQIGKTVLALSITDLALHVFGNNTNIGMFARNDGLRTENVRRLKELRNTLPSWLVKTGSKYSTDNQESLLYRPNNSKYITFVANPSKRVADQQGRGDSLIWQHWDEFSYYVNNSLAYPSAIAASETVGRIARDVGIPAAHMITTTAGFTESKEGRYAYNFKNKALRFTEHLFDIESRDALHDLVSTASDNLYVYLEYSHEQLGFDDMWLRGVSVNKDPTTIAKDYLNQWIHGAGDSVVPTATIDKLRVGIMEPLTVTIEFDILLKWFMDSSMLDDPKVRNIPFIIGADTSSNSGRDFTTLVMTNPMDMAVVMTCRCNEANMVKVVEVVFELLKRFPRSVFVPERNYAATFIDILLHRIENETDWNPFRRIFNYFVQEKASAEQTKHDLNMGSIRKQFGFKTLGGDKSRSLLYGKVLMTTAERNHNRIFDKDIVDEICGLVTRNGRVDHAVDGHDDTLIAYLISCWFIMYGRNIELYGISKNEILADTIKESEDMLMSRELHKRVTYLEQQLKNPRVSKLMHKAYRNEYLQLKVLIDETPAENRDIISIHQHDEIVNEAAPKYSIAQLSSMVSGIF